MGRRQSLGGGRGGGVRAESGEGGKVVDVHLGWAVNLECWRVKRS